MLTTIHRKVNTACVRMECIHQRLPLQPGGSFGKIFLPIDFLLSIICQGGAKTMINATWLGRSTVTVYEFR